MLRGHHCQDKNCLLEILLAWQIPPSSFRLEGIFFFWLRLLSEKSPLLFPGAQTYLVPVLPHPLPSPSVMHLAASIWGSVSILGKCLQASDCSHVRFTARRVQEQFLLPLGLNEMEKKKKETPLGRSFSSFIAMWLCRDGKRWPSVWNVAMLPS